MFAPAVCRRAHNAKCLIEFFTKNSFAEVAELVDAPASGAGGGNLVPVRVRPSVPFLCSLDNHDSRVRTFTYNRVCSVRTGRNEINRTTR